MKSIIKVLLSRYFYQADLNFIQERIPEVVFLNSQKFDDDALIKACENGVDVVLGPPPSKYVLELISHELSFIQIPWTGVENIDFSVCKLHAVTVCNSHGNALSVAEMAFSLILAVVKLIPFHDSELRKGLWHRPGDELGFYPPKLLANMTIGYYGFGSINKSLKKLLTGFDLNHCAYVSKHRKSHDNIQFYADEDFDIFLKECDIIVIGAPLTDKTLNKFDFHAFSKMKKSGYLVNVSRGKIVNEKDLFDALSSEKIAGAAVDTWYHYPSRGSSTSSPSSFDFSNLNNIVMSPHRAGFLANDFPHLQDVILNFEHFKNNKKLINIINFDNGY